jgi:Cu+-exporting ATPase
MTHPRDVVEHFQRAFYAGDAETARQYLYDDVAFDGPAASFTSAQDYLTTAAHVASIVHKIESERTFVDDGDVCVFSRLHTRALPEPLLVADWYHVRGERIASIRTIFDTGQFASGSVQQRQDSAVDPVCHMSVDTDRPASTRVWENATYYFCSEGCARAFSNTPPRYLTRD